MSKGKKVVIGIIILLLLLTLGIYGGGVYYFSSHFLPGSKINGLDCSFKTVEQSQEIIADQIATYTLQLKELNDGMEAISAADVGLEYVEDDSVKKLMDSQDRKKWFMAITSTKKYSMSASTTYNKKKLAKTVKNLNCLQDMTQPQNAYIDEQGDSYGIVPEVEGNALEEENILKLVTEAVEKGEKELDLVALDCYLKPTVYQDDKKLNKEVKELNKYTQATIYYDFGDREEIVDRDLIKSWLVKGEDGSYSLSDEAIADYVYGLAYKYDTFGSSRQFVTTSGQEITTQGGDYGWVIKQADTAAELKAAIEAGETKTMTPVYLFSGYSRDSYDIGNTYVEIDLTNQMMYFYKEGTLLVETPVVTGNPSRGNATPPGVFALDNKKSPAVLKGEDYASDVTYWMPFNQNVGIHDCGTWRTEFGGDIYLTNGSHGCVNTPYAEAEEIYNNIEIGMPIIVY